MSQECAVVAKLINELLRRMDTSIGTEMTWLR